MLACGTVVCGMSFINPRVGIGHCFNAHYILVIGLAHSALQLLPAAIRESRPIGAGTYVLLNVSLFLVPAVVLYVKAAQRVYLPALIVLTGLYLTSYFFLFPLRDCF